MSEDSGGWQSDLPGEGTQAPPPGYGTPSYPPPPPPPPKPPQSGSVQPPDAQPGYPQQWYGQPGPGPGQQWYGQPGPPQQAYGQPGYGYGPNPRTNGLAVASLCCSIAGVILIGFPAILGVIFGFVGRSQINRSNGAQKGGGLALAGIIIGLLVLAFWLLVIAIAIAHPECATNRGGC